MHILILILSLGLHHSAAKPKPELNLDTMQMYCPDGYYIQKGKCRLAEEGEYSSSEVFPH